MESSQAECFLTQDLGEFCSFAAEIGALCPKSSADWELTIPWNKALCINNKALWKKRSFSTRKS